MFKYNELSDLIDSDELVTPLQKEGDKILCRCSNGELLYYKFEDFDFDKTPDQRTQDVEIEIVEPEPEPEKIIIIEDTNIEENIVVSAAFIKIKSYKKENKDYFVTDEKEKIKILDKAGYKYKKINNVKIYVEEM